MQITLSAGLLLTTACSVYAQTRIVERPVIEAANTLTPVIERVEATDDATTLHIRGVFTPHYWIRISPSTTLVAEGKHYKIIGAEGIVPGEQLWMPDSGDSCFTLKFEPLPKHVKRFDFTEGEGEGNFHIYGIDLTGRKREAFPQGLPEALHKAPQTDSPESLAFSYTLGETKLRIHMLGFRPGLGEATMYVNTLFQGQREVPIHFDESTGVAEASLRLYGSATAFLVMNRRSMAEFQIAPNEMVEIYADASSIYEQMHNQRTVQLPPRKKSWTQGSQYDILNNMPQLTQNPLEGIDAYYPHYETSAEACTDSIISMYRTVCQRLDAADMSQLQRHLYQMEWACYAANDLFEADWRRYMDYRRHHRDIPQEQITYRPDSIRPGQVRRLLELLPLNDPMLLLAKNADDLQYTPVTQLDKELCGPIYYIATAREAVRKAEGTPLSDTELQLFRQWSNPFFASMLQEISENTRRAMNASQGLITPVSDVPNEQLFEAITAPHKGKVVLVDFWATWCSPCRAAIRANEPLKKKELADENLVWIYITNESSPMGTYTKSIPQIKGIHYRLNRAQWEYLTSTQFHIDGIPSYVLVQKDGHADLRNDLRNHSLLVRTLKEALK